jgi:hypothetical protein
MDDLIYSSNSVEELSYFLDINSTTIYDFFISQSHQSILSHREKIEGYILPSYPIYSNLDFDKPRNKTFILCLLDCSERFGLHTEFQQLFNLCQNESISIGSRLEASSKFLVGIHNVADYSERVSEIIGLLAKSFLQEEDDEKKVFATLIHYYTEVLMNFGFQNQAAVIEFRRSLLNELLKENNKFLINSTLSEILNEALVDIEVLYESIHEKLDLLLDRSYEFLEFNSGVELIELNTDYSNSIDSIASGFMNIRNLCSSLYSEVASEEIFLSLQRGVKVLTEHNQLLAYLHSYGKMHFAKIMSAFVSLPVEDFTSQIGIYDWGCGQGLASVCFLEYLEDQSTDINIDSVTLIEPSEIALRRAALHVKKFNNTTNLITLNNDLDSVDPNNFNSKIGSIKIQLFSNILDIDHFSMSDLVLKIKNSFKGSNYFICVSPYVSEHKTQRINDFVKNFEDLDDFDLITEITERKGEWEGKAWSRVIRVFKAEL